MNDPLVSILTPCYNHSIYLEDYLKCVIAQDYENIELIIVDDNSSDDSIKVIERYSKSLNCRFVRFLLIKNETNKGVTKNCNLLLKKANGKYVRILASDDLLERTAIRECVEHLEKHPEAFACINNGFVVKESFRYDDKRGFLQKIYYSDLSDIFDSISDRLLEIELEGNVISAPCVTVRKDAFDIIGKYDESCICEDYDCWMRIIKHGRFCFLNRNLTYYRISEKSLSHDKNNRYEMIIDDLKIKAKYCNKIMQKKYYSEALSRCAAIGFTNMEKELMTIIRDANNVLS